MQISTPTRRFLALWTPFAVLWAGYVLAQPPSYGDRDDIVVFAAFPPLITLLSGLLLLWTWQRFASAHWFKLAPHLRRGLLRLYLAIALPWLAWFGLQILINGPDWEYLPQNFWWMLTVPIGGPILLIVIAWVAAGFQTSELKSEGRPVPLIKQNNRPSEKASVARQPPHDYHAVINEAVQRLARNDFVTRRELYRRARTTLQLQLQGQEHLSMNGELRALEQAIRDAETSAVNAERDRQRFFSQSTVYLGLSIYLFPHLWAIDFTSMSLFWVARLPNNQQITI